MVENGQWLTMNNGRPWSMVDNGQWWTMDSCGPMVENGRQWNMVDIGQWWTVLDNEQWWTMVYNVQWWTINEQCWTMDNGSTCCKLYEMVPISIVVPHGSLFS